jgi:4-hydroxybenzoate polyprenyltransferase
VFTAISNAMAGLLLRSAVGPAPADVLDLEHILSLTLVSIGLYGFGMSLNDIIDRRRDSQMAAHRPLPSGRIGVVSAHVVCAVLALLALVAGFVFGQITPGGRMSFAVVVWCMMLIIFYDAIGKYLVAAGLLSLGLIRFFHASVPQPGLIVPWHPLLLLNHVAILSAVCYYWETKRPAINRRHVMLLIIGIVMVNLAVIFPLWYRRSAGTMDVQGFLTGLSVTGALVWPMLAVVGFVLIALLVRRRAPDARSAGQTLMLYGLLWLIVYDAAFVAGYVGLIPALIIFALLPVSYLSVLLMRTWSRLIYLSQKPEYQRAR